MLGRLTVLKDGCVLDLPSSRKLQALLAYLALTPGAVARTRLCALLWDTASDPRGELRWHLSKLRSIVGDERVTAGDDCVRLDLAGIVVDALEVRRAAQAGIGTLALERSRALLGRFGGDLLEGVEIERCPEFTAWLLAQRRRFRAWRIALLERLAESADDAESLDYAEKWLELDPLDVRPHERLLGALARRGRFREGKRHLAASTKLFMAEGLDCGALRRAWHAATARSSSRAARMPPSREAGHAYDYYLQGRLQLSRMMQRGLVASGEMFARAIELDAGHAPAWAGLATAHACLHEWFDPGKARLEQAERASRRALELAPQLAEAHVARGLVRSLSRHYDEAVSELEQGIRINPYLFDAYYYFARTAFALGDMARAAEMFHLAAQLGAEDFQSPILLGTALRALGREDAEHDAVRIGIRRAEQVLTLNPHDGRALSLCAGALVEDGQTDRALEWGRRALDLYPDDTSALVNLACVHARAGESGPALDLLERAFARGNGKRDWILNDPDYGSLRNEPRFERLVTRLG
jgi:DNA-binding SARP family transcriptional activator